MQKKEPSKKKYRRGKTIRGKSLGQTRAGKSVGKKVGLESSLRKRLENLNRYDIGIRASRANISQWQDSWELETEEKRKKEKMKNMQKETVKLVKEYLNAIAMLRKCKEDLPRVVAANLKVIRDKQKREYDRSQCDIWCQDKYLQPDRIVAAFSTQNFTNNEEQKHPILWKIIRVDDKGELFTVFDIDNSGKREMLSRKQLIPIPTLEQAPLSARKIFAQGEDVQAIFPGCTMFYPATVTFPPRASRPDFDVTGSNHSARAFQYQLVFHGDNGQEQWVDAEHVIPIDKLRKAS